MSQARPCAPLPRRAEFAGEALVCVCVCGGGGEVFLTIALYRPSRYIIAHHNVTVFCLSLCAGELLSVAPSFLRMVQGLFSFNERVVLRGSWAHGPFYYTAIGAYNVGSIFMNCCPDVITNQTFARQPFSRSLGPVDIGKGDEIGAFLLGSSIALVFEAPEVRRLAHPTEMSALVWCTRERGGGGTDDMAEELGDRVNSDATLRFAECCLLFVV